MDKKMIYDKKNPNEETLNAIWLVINAIKTRHILANTVFKFHNIFVGKQYMDFTICFICLESGGVQAYISGSGSCSMSAKPVAYSLRRIESLFKQAESIELITF